MVIHFVIFVTWSLIDSAPQTSSSLAIRFSRWFSLERFKLHVRIFPMQQKMLEWGRPTYFELQDFHRSVDYGDGKVRSNKFCFFGMCKFINVFRSRQKNWSILSKITPSSLHIILSIWEKRIHNSIILGQYLSMWKMHVLPDIFRER